MSDQSPTVGKQLQQARLEQGLTLNELSVSTRIKERYLAAIEADRFQILPSPIQQKGFVRAYAQALGLDPDAVVAQLPIIQKARQESAAESKDPTAEKDPIGDTDQGINSMGQTIRNQRERLGYVLRNVEDQIYIPERYLEAIEQGELDRLPSPVQGRGMVKNYAEFLGLDPDPLLLQYAETLQERYRAKNPPAEKSSSGITLPIWLRRLVSGPLLTGLSIILLVVGALVGSSFFVFGRQEAELPATATIPGVAEILLPSDTPLPSLSPSPESPGEIDVQVTLTLAEEAAELEEIPATATINALTTKNVQVQLIILQRTWVRIVVDNDQVVFEGRLLPGTVETFEAENRLELLTGNAGGVEVIFNQQDLGVLGLYGEVVSRVYTADGIATPTPTVTLTPTITATSPPTITPTPSPAAPE